MYLRISDNAHSCPDPTGRVLTANRDSASLRVFKIGHPGRQKIVPKMFAWFDGEEVAFHNRSDVLC